MKLTIEDSGVYAFQLLLDVPVKPAENEKRLVFFAVHTLKDGKILDNYDLYQVLAKITRGALTIGFLLRRDFF